MSKQYEEPTIANTPPATGALPPVERLDAGEADYHRALMEELVQAQAAWGAWRRHLSKKYRLGEADGIDANGAIHRAAPASGE